MEELETLMTATTERKLFVETVTERIDKHVLASTIRPATPEDVAAAQARVDRGEPCDHTIVWDEPGWLYDTRSCHTCGAGLGTV